MNWRGRGADPAVTRQRLIEAAHAEVAEHGVAATSVDAVAARAGLTKGAVYSTFGSRAELVFSMVDAFPDPDIEISSDALNDGDWEAVGAQLASAADAAPEQVFLLLELMAQAHRDPGLHVRISNRFSESERRVATIVRGLAAVDDETAGRIASRLHAQLLGLWSIRALLGPERVPNEAFVAMLRDLLADIGSLS